MTEKVLNIVIVVCVIGMAACIFLLGMKMGIYTGDIRVAELEKTQAVAERKAATETRDKLIAAQQVSDALQRRLDAADQARLSQSLEHSREIKRLTRGQPCLNAGTVRLLNRSGGIKQPALPETASRPAAEDAAAATDTDVAEWVDHAIRQYDTCRDRLGALIDFEEGQ